MMMHHHLLACTVYVATSLCQGILCNIPLIGPFWDQIKLFVVYAFAQRLFLLVACTQRSAVHSTAWVSVGWFITSSCLCVPLCNRALNLDNVLGALDVETSRDPSKPRSDVQLGVVKIKDASRLHNLAQIYNFEGHIGPRVIDGPMLVSSHAQRFKKWYEMITDPMRVGWSINSLYFCVCISISVLNLDGKLAMQGQFYWKYDWSINPVCLYVYIGLRCIKSTELELSTLDALGLNKNAYI